MHSLTEDYSRHQVPKEATVSGLSIALVIIGFSITLPLMLAGTHIAASLGLQQSIGVFFAGGLILTAIGALTAAVAASARVSTYKIIEISFGIRGAKLVSLLLALTLLGWYGVTAALFGEAAFNAIKTVFHVELSVTLFTVVGSVLMIAVTLFGFKSLERLSLFAVPLMIAFLCHLLWSASEAVTWSRLWSLNGRGGMESFGVAVSVVVGSYSVGVTILPDLCRYARSTAHGTIAVTVALGLALPLILVTAAVPSVVTGHADLVKTMMELGLGIAALLLIVFAALTSNANNLYSTSLALAVVFIRMPKWRLTLYAGIASTLVAAIGIMDYFMPFLLALGIAVPPVAGIYIADFFLIKGPVEYRNIGAQPRPGFSVAALAAWFCGAGAGAASAQGSFTLTGIASCDAILAALLSYCLLNRLSLTATLRELIPKAPPDNSPPQNRHKSD